MGDPGNGLPHAGKAERSPPVTAPVISGSSPDAVALLSIFPGADEPNITLILERFKPRRAQPVG